MPESTPWYYQSAGQQAGPLSEAALREMLRSGQLSPEAQVWRQGMAGWQPARSVPELAAVAPGAGPVQPVDLPLLIGLSIVTFTVYGVVKFYQAAKAYELLAARRSSFDTLFWTYVGLAAGALVLGIPFHPLGAVLGLGSAVVSVLVLNEVLTLRAEVLRSRGLRLDLTSDAAHRVLFIVGIVASTFLVGLALLLAQAVLFFQDHNKIAAALSGPTQPLTTVPTGPPAMPSAGVPPPAAKTCASCGSVLASDARFCSRCGTPTGA
jgi:hypothetical protein